MGKIIENLVILTSTKKPLGLTTHGSVCVGLGPLGVELYIPLIMISWNDAKTLLVRLGSPFWIHCAPYHVGGTRHQFILCLSPPLLECGQAP